MGIINTLTKAKATRVIGIDASTNSLAFAVFDGEKPVLCGEVKFNGATVFERLQDAKKKTRLLVKAGYLQGDYIAIESAVMVRNVQTAIDLAYVYGAILGELGEGTKQLNKVAPISWQTGIGNPNLKKAEKEAIQKEFPGKSKSWYQNKGREIRKQRTAELMSKYFPKAKSYSDNVTDAIGISLYASTVLTRR